MQGERSEIRELGRSEKVVSGGWHWIDGCVSQLNGRVDKKVFRTGAVSEITSSVFDGQSGVVENGVKIGVVRFQFGLA